MGQHHGSDEDPGRYEQVWDLKNAGPRHRFTVLGDRPIVVHNCTQATCNDLLRHAMTLLQASGFPVVAHVHDETVEEASEDDVEAIKALMETRPPWAADFPLVAKVHAADRYTK